METLHRRYPKPVLQNLVSNDVGSLIAAYDMIDADMAAVLLALNSKAPAVHHHNIEDIDNLAVVLAEKSPTNHKHALDDISGVSGTAAAPAGYVLMKTATGWSPGDPANLIGSHYHAIGDITNLSTVLAAKLDAATAAGLTAKATPADADTITITDSAASGAFKKLSWQAIKAALKSYFDGLYHPKGSYAPATHGHAISDVADLVPVLGGKVAATTSATIPIGVPVLMTARGAGTVVANGSTVTGTAVGPAIYSGSTLSAGGAQNGIWLNISGAQIDNATAGLMVRTS